MLYMKYMKNNLIRKEDEYTTGTVDDFKDYLNERYGRTEDIDLEDFIKKMGIESTVDEIDKICEKEREDEEIKIEPENTSDIDEKVINTAEIPSASESSESEEYFEEENEEFELYLGDQDLNLGDLFKENDFEYIEMALNIAKPSYFSRELDEDPNEWVKQFDRAAEANVWVNDDVANNLRTRMAKAYLKGVAADWCDDNNAAITHW